MSKKIHFVGIGGSGISGVAKLSEKMGYSVTGCDLEKSTAYVEGIYKGHSVVHLKDIDLLVVSPAVYYQNSENPELAEGQKRGIAITWEEFVGKYLAKGKKVICIAGTHGKSTTTAMAGKLLIDAGFDPTVVLGANVPEWDGNSRFGRGEYFLIEADEFNDNFLNYHPDIAIINNIEFDHPDYFKNEDEVKSSFKKFVGNLVGKKILITEKDSLNIKFNLHIPGEHNQKNANMVFLLGRKLGISDENIVKSLESFRGIGRRLELIADRGGIKVYDDYAHHPTAIAATLQGLREEYPKAKILAIDEPHGYKRTKALLTKYKGVFDNADKVIIGPIFKARDEADLSVTPELVAKFSNHKNIVGFESFEDLIRNLKLKIRNSNHENYEVIVVMGAGKSYLWAREIVETLSEVGELHSFKELTSFRIGGKINKYFEVKNENEIREALEFSKQNKLPIFIIGDGTDILVSDKDFSGVVIKYVGKKISVNEDGTVIAEAGANWDKLVEVAVSNGLGGIEDLSGIPGTVGAAPIQNIGAYGAELKDTVVSLEAYDLEKSKLVTFSKDGCKFGYRESIFKKSGYWQKYIITQIKLKLIKAKYGKANYESLSKYITSKKPTITEVRNAVLKVRSEKLENPKEVGNAGSFFKNPIIDLKVRERLESKHRDAKIFPFGKKFKIPAGWLIEKTGWKGKTYKGAAVSEKHALILINKSGNAKAQDVIDLSDKIIADVNKKFGVKLEREVQLINF